MPVVLSTSRASTLDIIADAARGMSHVLYTNTRWPAEAIGVRVPPEVFERVALLYAEQTGEAAADVLARGYVDLRVDDEFDLRITTDKETTDE